MTFVLMSSQVIGIGLAGFYVEKVTDGVLRKFDQCQTGIFNGFTLQLTLIIATSIILVFLILSKLLIPRPQILEKIS